MKIAIDSNLISLYARMLNPSNRQKNNLPSNLRYAAPDKNALDIIDALEKIHQSGGIYCKLPSNREELNQFPQVDKHLRECCIKGYEFKVIDQRADELSKSHEDMKYCKLLAEAEECGVNILLTTSGSFKENLEAKAKNNVRILHPFHDLSLIVK